MRTRLDPAGKIYPPDSITHARERLQALDVEMDNIQGQLNGTRVVLYTGSYLLWHARALTRLEQIKSEHEQTVAWIEEQERQLFRDAVKLLRTLHDDDVGLTDKEEALLLRAEVAIETMDETKPQKGE